MQEHDMHQKHREQFWARVSLLLLLVRDSITIKGRSRELQLFSQCPVMLETGSYAHGAFNLRGKKGRLNSFNVTLPSPALFSSWHLLLLRHKSNFPLRSYTEVGQLLTLMFVFLGDSSTPSLGVDSMF